MSILIILLLFVIIALFYVHQSLSVQEHFTMSQPCPNSFKRNAMECRQCPDLMWCQTPQGYGVCVPKRNPAGCAKLSSKPDVEKEAYLYLPGQRRWWWWTLSEKEREVLKNAVNIPQPIIL